MIKKISIRTKFGWISALERREKIYKIKFGKVNNQSNSKILISFRKNLLKFLDRKTLKIRGSYEIEGNQIQKKVWKELTNIKLGQTKTYGQIAKKFKLSPRHVGKICSQNKIVLVIPCHRVIRSDGGIGGFSSVGGIKLKKKILDFEKSW